MVGGIFDSRGKPISSSFNPPNTSIYDKVIGTLDASSKAGSVASGGKGVLPDRVGTSAFLGTIVVRDNGGTEKVRIGKLDVGVWGIRVSDGVIEGGSIAIGAANNIFKADSNGIYLGNAVFANAPFSVDMTGSLKAQKGTIGGFTIESNKLYGSTLQTSRTVGAGSTGVVMDTAGLRGYDAVLGQTFNLPTDGSAPTFSSGIINSTIFNLQTSSVIRTSETVGDGTANSAGVLMNSTGIYATQANQTLADANVKILATGEATFSGNVKGGQTDFMSGSGYFIGLSGGEYKMSIGVPTGNYISWDGYNLRIKGSLELTSPLTNISFTTANLPIPPTTVGWNAPSGNEA